MELRPWYKVMRAVALVALCCGVGVAVWRTEWRSLDESRRPDNTITSDPPTVTDNTHHVITPPAHP
eukprot:6134128-Prorocentrum_lima.AAC.1